MPMPTMTFSNANRDWGFLGNTGPGNYSTEQVVIAASARSTVLLPGTVLGKAAAGAGTLAVAAAVSGAGGTPGNGTVSGLGYNAGALKGVYQVRITDPAGGGKFEVQAPDGSVDGDGAVGTAYVGNGIKFTITAGSTAFAEDDRIPITLTYAASAGLVAPLSLTALDGGQVADTILGARLPAGTTNKRVAVAARHAEIVQNLLVWPAGITASQLATAIGQLAAKGLIVRPNV